MPDYDERTPDSATNTQYKVMLSGYKWALSMLKEPEKLDILDCACGLGYGSGYMAARAGKVTGVDISEDAIRHCKSAYKSGNLSFEVMDAAELKFPDGRFDAVVSQDTIEHVPDDRKFLAEIARVLKKDGVFMVFTPHSPVHNEKPENIYHLREYGLGSLDGLLRAFFSKIEYYGRRPSPALKKLEAELASARSLDRFGIRSMLPVRIRHFAGSIIARLRGAKPLEEITEDDLEFFPGVGTSPTIIAVCKK